MGTNTLNNAIALADHIALLVWVTMWLVDRRRRRNTPPPPTDPWAEAVAYGRATPDDKPTDPSWWARLIRRIGRR